MHSPTPRYFSRFIIALTLFISLLLIGTGGYRWLEGMSLLDALYMTVITISTVGFGEIRPLSAEGRFFTIGLIIGGAGLVAFSASAAIDLMLLGEWQAYWKNRRRKHMLSDLNDHVIVCGYGRVGRHVAEELAAEGVPFVVVDTDPERSARAERLNYLCLTGNAANENVLKELGIKRARALITAVDSDAENVFITLTARSLRPDLYIVARVNYEDSEPKLLKAGANRTLLPYSISGKRMATMILRPNVADFLDQVSHAGGLELLLEQVQIDANSTLDRQTLAEANLSGELGISVLACRGKDGIFHTPPGPDTVLQGGTSIIAIGTRQQLQALIKLAKKI